jgi:transcriptional regulator with XRE-family HTH domain
MDTSPNTIIFYHNPFVILRASARGPNGLPLTQEDLAALSGVSEQFIRRQEMGLINSPSSKVSHALLKYSPNFDNEIRNGVADLINFMGYSKIPDNLQKLFDRSDLYQPYANDTPGFNKTGRVLSEWYHYWAHCRRVISGRELYEVDFTKCKNVAQLIDAVCIMLDMPPTVYSFAKALALHPYTVQNTLADSNTMGLLADALFDAGIEWGHHVG